MKVILDNDSNERIEIVTPAGTIKVWSTGLRMMESYRHTEIIVSPNRDLQSISVDLDNQLNNEEEGFDEITVVIRGHVKQISDYPPALSKGLIWNLRLQNLSSKKAKSSQSSAISMRMPLIAEKLELLRTSIAKYMLGMTEP